MTENIISIENVSKKFPSQPIPALDQISASVPKGKMVGIAGPDGAGKTTLIRLIAGLLLPSQGKIEVAGYDSAKQAKEIHNFIGYMPQKFGLYEDLTVMQNLNLYADLQGVLGNERKQAYDKVLHFTNLAPFTTRLAGALSGGMKQKLGLACTLIRKPRLLLLDEPSVGVDPISRRELWKMVLALLGEGISVIWSTAYLDEAERCDYVLLLNEGKLLFYGPPSNLTDRVKDRVFRVSDFAESKRLVLSSFLNQNNVIDGVIQGSSVRIVAKDPSFLSEAQSNLSERSFHIQPIQPRFEDAFVDILGGGPGGVSVLAQKIPEKQKDDQIIVEAKNLTKKFGSFTAVDHISFQVKRGEIFGLLGPNGAGKSTTFKMLCGLLQPTQGQALVQGLDLQKAPGQARARLGYMAQKFSLYGDLSVLQNLIFFSGVYNLPIQKRKNAIDGIIEIFNFKNYIHDSASNLSLGYKQRLALSCSVMHQPDVLFLDEPTSGVDPLTRREFWNHINGLVEKGVTVVVTTHFMDEAESCDRIGLIYMGKIIETGSPDELKNRAATPNIPNPTLEDAFIKLIEEYDSKRPVS